MTAKKALLIGLVVLLALIGIPMLMPGMAMAHCPDCTLAPRCVSCIPAVLAVGATIAFTLASSQVRHRATVNRLFLLSSRFDRPPQR